MSDRTIDRAGPADALVRYDVVVPSVGRSSLSRTLTGLAEGPGPWPERLIVVDDRPDPSGPLIDELPPIPVPVVIARSHGRGPAAARNVGWRTGGAPWVVFLDDDVEPEAGWRRDLTEDLAHLHPEIGACQGRVEVPAPSGRPTDWERDVAGLASAHWITADLAVRRAALRAVGGFDERFPRAYREDADLAVRLRRAGFRLTQGRRRVRHPVRPAPWWISVGRQAGNMDDALMRRLHGRRWREVAGAGRGRLAHHLMTTALLVGGLVGTVARPTRAIGRIALVSGAIDAAEFAWQRIRPGPRTADEVARMVVTSFAIPPVATAHRVRGWIRARRLAPSRGPAAVLFDRDGTLVVDVPYNGNPDLVQPVPGAREALDRLRVAGVPLGVVSNQSGVARGLLQQREVAAVNAKIDDDLGPMDVWRICVHDDDDGCDCRKPSPGLIRDAAADLGVPVERCVVVGDIGSDVEAARRAGARAVLVPTAATRPAEIAAADVVAPDLETAVDLLIGPRR